ncbi:hypothetical protein LMG31506_03147 [Cupriavidus yeoncheonensis]|uniref:Uncharacterized protein n=1 Tax=Cupriavidus yeoncheonensis TaxID=1462994 RepID=A0A916IVT3_9BURK|nr:hypothetical protein LMG31506_03147 [Cupriavidus yeoncheonensis]
MLFQMGLQVQDAASACQSESVSSRYLVIDLGGPIYALND